jgi:hypothetical protein
LLTAHDTDEEKDHESQTADNQISLLVSRLRTRYSGWSVVSGLWSVVFPTLFPSLPSVKNPFARRRRRVYGYGKPQVHHGESVPWRTRNARAILRWLEKTRRRLHGAA